MLYFHPCVCQLITISLIPIFSSSVSAPGAPQRSNQDAEEISQLREENAKLTKTIQTLRKEVDELRTSMKVANATDESKVNELKLDLIQTKQELNRARDALQGKRLINNSCPIIG